MQDHEIIELYFQRDQTAIAATDETYGRRLERMAGGFVSEEDAKECLNDTYLSAWNHIPPVRPISLFAWLAKVIRNFALGRIEWNNAQKRSGIFVELDTELEQCLPDQAAELEFARQELTEILNTFLRGLSKEKRQLFLKRYWYGASIKELAEESGLSESKVKTTLFRVRAELKVCLEKEGVFV